MLVGVVTAAPVTATAAIEKKPVSAGAVEVKSDSTVGAILGSAMQTNEKSQETSQCITDVTVEGNAATVTLMHTRKCNLIVGIYDETTDQLLQTSQRREICPYEETEVTVTFADDLPQYFYLRAFILDNNCAPIGNAFETDRYTRAYAQFLAKTTADFPAQRVLNFDNSQNNNFAVYDSKVKQISFDANHKPTVGDTYTFTNADDSVRNLKEGEIFTFDNNGTPEFVKIASISVNGDTVTVTPDDVQATEVFEYVKIDVTATATEADMSAADDGVEMITPDENSVGAIDMEYDYYLPFHFDFSRAMKDGGISISGVSGTVDITAKMHYRLYIGNGILETELSEQVTGSIDVQVGIKVNYDIKLPKLKFLTPIWGLMVFLKPEIQIEVSASFHGKVDFSEQLGFSYNTKTGFKNLSKTPKLDAVADFEGSIYVGLKFAPGVSALLGLVETNPEITVGLEAVGKRVITRTGDSDSDHLCRWCIDGDLLAKVGISAELRTGKIKNFKLALSVKIIDWEKKLKDYYISSDIGFGWGDCPNYADDGGEGYCALCGYDVGAPYTGKNDNTPVGAASSGHYPNERYLIAVEDSQNGMLNGNISALVQVTADQNGNVELPDSVTAGGGEYVNLYGACSHPSAHVNANRYYCDVCGAYLPYYHAYELLAGDVNSDGKVDISDATAIQRYLTRMVTLTTAERNAADTNGDGTISISDATQIQKYLAQIVTRLGK